ncbi:MAG: hypothetical protein GAK35_02394 [Herbaspirillum frisingense]|uniref:Transglycosylase SLT domain-containing protein n=1 Tax=Herbaspirillum frisingense TaxID=92645 RepID=A0A7V8FWA8_9BURK|nr:MAG: hypothetical protein GAK35_02394 [Herbaspirillum frisingense]
MDAALILPRLALVYLPVLLQAQQQIWPDAPMPSFLAAQVEQESCISLSHPKCWNPQAELKTDREYGFGFGQITRATRPDGSVRFDKFSELKAAYPSLASWTWADRFNPSMQLTALVEMDNGIYRRIDAATDRDRLAMTLSAYNGGEGGLVQDIWQCKLKSGCDPRRWFGHVELTSNKSRVKWKGYGKSAFEINREYPRNVLDLRRAKYVPFME